MKWFPLVPLAGLLAIPLFKRMYATAHLNRLVKQTIYLEELPADFDEYKLFFISDVHRRVISTELLDEVGSCDMVIIGGDLLEKGVPLKRIEQNLRSLASCGPTYFVWGNNDVEIDEDTVRSILHAAGINELNNSTDLIKRNNNSMLVAGGIEPTEADMYTDLLNEASKSEFSMFVCHFPEAFKQLPYDHPFSFLLAGHTHGGQIRISGLSVAPHGSIKKVGDAVHFVSNGYGTSKLPLRLGALPETHLFTLKSGPTSIKSPIVYHF